MSEVASNIDLVQRLRVAVYADDPLRRAALCKTIAEAGHVIVDLQEDADLVLADSRLPAEEVRNVVGLGIADDRLRGALPREAAARLFVAVFCVVVVTLTIVPPRTTRRAALRPMRSLPK